MAYNIGDEEEIETVIDKEIKALREEFVGEMFEVKEEFQKGAYSSDDDEKEEAYKILIEFLKKFIEKFVRLEKNKYMRERVYYQRSGQIAMYEHANRLYNNARPNVEENIVKQAKSVMKPSPGDFEKYFGDLYHAAEGDDDDKIQDRISEYEARKYMDMWTKIKTGFAHEK